MVLMMSLAVVILTGCKTTTPQKQEKEETSAQVTAIPSPTQIPDVTPELTKAPEVEETVEFTVESLKEFSKEMTEQLVDKNATSIYECFAEEYQTELSADYLLDAYEQTVAPLGAYVSLNSIQSQKVNDYLVIGIVLEYENNGLLVTYTFNSDVRLEGFYMRYQTLDTDEVISDEYEEQEIQIGKGEYIIDGILTLPKGTKNPPVIILVQGSGQSDMDETIGAVSNKPFKDIAHGLAKQGIATIRYNKRYYQYMDQMPENMTVEDEILEDVSYAIDFAMQCKLINSNNIYIAGHSLGGILAPKIANDNIEVKGIIVLAGSARKLEDIIYDQVVILAEQEEISTEEKELYINMVKANVELVKNLDEEDLASPILGLTGYYWKALNEIDTASIVQSLTVPMLFLQGSADFQIFADKDFTLWKELLIDNEHAEFIEYENLNHLFMPTTGIIGIEDYNTKNKVSDQVIEDIALWVNQNKN